MRISVFGLGYVGVVSASCLARDGHTVIGVDVQDSKVDLINQGQAPLIEHGVPELIEAATKSGQLSARKDAVSAVNDTEMSLVCVGTPSERNGSLNTRAVKRVCEEIGAAIGQKADFHIVVIRSTILPGTMRRLVVPTLERASGKRAGEDFGVAFNPEFLRESTAVEDYDNPPKTVIGAMDDKSAAKLAEIYAHLDAPLFTVSIDTAEMVKYVDNTWHALKVAFGNEIGTICKAVGVDSYQVMDIFCQDTKLNISPAYLKPGFAFGGSCLPKDVRALSHCARTMDLHTPVINAILPSNRHQIDRAYETVAEQGRRKVAVLGISFKPGTDDIRESPQVELTERLIGKGYDVRIYDKNVRLAKLVGANREYMLNVIPHISDLMVDTLDEALAHGETVIIGNGAKEFSQVASRLRPEQFLLDLARVGGTETLGDRYYGINW